MPASSGPPTFFFVAGDSIECAKFREDARRNGDILVTTHEQVTGLTPEERDSFFFVSDQNSHSDTEWFRDTFPNSTVVLPSWNGKSNAERYVLHQNLSDAADVGMDESIVDFSARDDAELDPERTSSDEERVGSQENVFVASTEVSSKSFADVYLDPNAKMPLPKGLKGALATDFYHPKYVISAKTSFLLDKRKAYVANMTFDDFDVAENSVDLRHLMEKNAMGDGWVSTPAYKSALKAIEFPFVCPLGEFEGEQWYLGRIFGRIMNEKPPPRGEFVEFEDFSEWERSHEAKTVPESVAAAAMERVEAVDPIHGTLTFDGSVWTNWVAGNPPTYVSTLLSSPTPSPVKMPRSPVKSAAVASSAASSAASVVRSSAAKKRKLDFSQSGLSPAAPSSSSSSSSDAADDDDDNEYGVLTSIVSRVAPQKGPDLVAPADDSPRFAKLWFAYCGHSKFAHQVISNQIDAKVAKNRRWRNTLDKLLLDARREHDSDKRAELLGRIKRSGKSDLDIEERICFLAMHLKGKDQLDRLGLSCLD